MIITSWTIKRRQPIQYYRRRRKLQRRFAAALVCLCLIALQLTYGLHAEPHRLSASDLNGRGLTANNAPDSPTAPSQQPAAFISQRAFEPGPAAAAFSMRGMSALTRFRATLCLTSAIYYEAANEPDDGQRAIAQVVLNRVRHPAYPHNVCDVVYQGSERATGCQFTFSCDGSTARVPMSAPWARARRHAMEALNGYVHAPIGLATHYHTLAVAPYWGNSLRKAGIIGAHIFYRWPGPAGEAPAFNAHYTGLEPLPIPHPRAVAPTPPVDPLFTGTAYPALTQHPPAPTPASIASQWTTESNIVEKYRDSGKWIKD